MFNNIYYTYYKKRSGIASPSRVLLGATVCNIRSEENQLLKQMAWIALGSLVLVMIGMVLMLFIGTIASS